MEGNEQVVLEVQRHLGNGMARTVAMDTTDGLQRGCQYAAPSSRSGSSWYETLGRIFNVLGETIDNKGPVKPVSVIRSTDLRLPLKSRSPGWKFLKQV